MQVLLFPAMKPEDNRPVNAGHKAQVWVSLIGWGRTLLYSNRALSQSARAWLEHSRQCTLNHKLCSAVRTESAILLACCLWE